MLNSGFWCTRILFIRALYATTGFVRCTRNHVLEHVRTHTEFTILQQQEEHDAVEKAKLKEFDYIEVERSSQLRRCRAIKATNYQELAWLCKVNLFTIYLPCMKLPLIPNSEFAWYLHFLNTARVSSTPFLSKDTSIASLHLGFRGMRRNCVCLWILNVRPESAHRNEFCRRSRHYYIT